MLSSEGVRIGAEAVRRLRQMGCCAIGPGLTEAEFAHIEHEYGVEFADDHRAFLAEGLPLNGPVVEAEGVYRAWETPWPNWRDGDPDSLSKQLDWPIEGVIFDVEHNGRWHPTWGKRPTDRDGALETARLHLAQAPKMVPVYGHRYLPAGRGTFGHPVLSIWQTDIIYYGMDLIDYIHQEFGGPGVDGTDERWESRATVPFWRDL